MPNIRGKRRKMAASTLCGRLVAPRTMIPEAVVMPSHRTKNSDFKVELALPSDPSRGFKKVSNSSTKIMAGASLWAREKVAAMSLLDSPNHLSIILDSLISTKVASASLATALASIVLPVPGFPYNNIPLGGCTSSLSPNKSGRFNGKTHSCHNSCLISSKPPISLKSVVNMLGSTTSSAIFCSYELSSGNCFNFFRLFIISSNRFTALVLPGRPRCSCSIFFLIHELT
mmetsp:Transcript_7720/g.12787  ORF Transcript_7720/g.12787 Transcript_7720/m.12787 type:complete len:229 (-) Transcript_7720:125-811(-)